MDFKELAAKRYSLRKYSGKKVEEEKIQDLLETCRIAPTAVNYQPQRILVLDDEAQLAKLAQTTKYHFNAPLAMLVCYDKGEAWVRGADGQDSGAIDCAIVGTHLMMRAVELGLGSCWVMAFDPDKMRELYAIPNTLEPVALFPLGYPAEDAKPAHLHEKRKPVEETSFRNSF